MEEHDKVDKVRSLTNEATGGKIPAIKMLRPYGYIDEETDTHHYFPQDMIITDLDIIDDLEERGAFFEKVEVTEGE